MSGHGVSLTDGVCGALVLPQGVCVCVYVWSVKWRVWRVVCVCGRSSGTGWWGVSWSSSCEGWVRVQRTQQVTPKTDERLPGLPPVPVGDTGNLRRRLRISRQIDARDVT